jgi:hypothetical protein
MLGEQKSDQISLGLTFCGARLSPGLLLQNDCIFPLNAMRQGCRASACWLAQLAPLLWACEGVLCGCCVGAVWALQWGQSRAGLDVVDFSGHQKQHGSHSAAAGGALPPPVFPATRLDCDLR